MILLKILLYPIVLAYYMIMAAYCLLVLFLMITVNLGVILINIAKFLYQNIYNLIVYIKWRKNNRQGEKKYIKLKALHLVDFSWIPLPNYEKVTNNVFLNNKKDKKNEISIEEERFNKEADYYNLTKREREICKLENLTPEEYVEIVEDDIKDE